MDFGANQCPQIVWTDSNKTRTAHDSGIRFDYHATRQERRIVPDSGGQTMGGISVENEHMWNNGSIKRFEAHMSLLKLRT